MEFIIISLVALIASGLTLFSGFGLGTLLMPVVALFFSVEVAIAITALVHLTNNLFKVVLLGRKAYFPVLIRFGLPAVAFAFLGALTLTWLANTDPVFTYTVLDTQFQVLPLKLIVGLLILVFVILELTPRFADIAVEAKYLPWGGALSGFFGGLSGHQGAFRSMFLLKAGLNKEEFVATGVLLAVMVDLSRLLVYGWDLQYKAVDWSLVLAASVSAFAGAFIGSRILKKITITAVQIMVSGLLFVVALGLVSGIL